MLLKWLDVSFEPGGFSLLQCPDWLWSPYTSCSVCTGIKWLVHETDHLHLVLRLGWSGAVTARPRAPSLHAQRQNSPLLTLQAEAVKHAPQILTKATNNVTGT